MALEARDLAPAGLTIIVGEEVKTRDGDLICLFLERAIPPGMSAADTIAAAREQGAPGRACPHPFDRYRGSMLRDASDGAARRRAWTGSRPTTRGWSARATSRPPSSRTSTGCRAWPSRTPIRSWRSASPTRRRRRPVHAGRAPRGPRRRRDRARTRHVLRPRSGRRVAKGVNRVRGQPPGRPGGLAEPPDGGGDGRADRTRTIVRWWTGRWSGRVRARWRPPPPSTRRSRTHEPGIARRGARARIDRRRARSRSGSGYASRGRSCRSSSRSGSSRSSCTSTATGCRRSRPSSCRPTRPSSSLAFVVFYLGFPLRGYRWQRLLRETGFVIGLRNSTEILYLSWFVNCVVPAKLGDVYRAYLLKMNSDGLAQPDVRDRLHRAHPRHLRDRDPRPRAPASGASGAACRRRSRLVFIVGIVVVVVAAIGLFTMRNFGRRILDRLPLPAARPRAVRAVRGRRVRRRRASPPADPRDPHRADLADRGAAAVHRRPRARVRRTSSSGCRARSSSRSSARC